LLLYNPELADEGQGLQVPLYRVHDADDAERHNAKTHEAANGGLLAGVGNEVAAAFPCTLLSLFPIPPFLVMPQTKT
jgi:hypothetical protein